MIAKHPAAARIVAEAFGRSLTATEALCGLKYHLFKIGTLNQFLRTPLRNPPVNFGS
jgi:hypothetical protein